MDDLIKYRLSSAKEKLTSAKLLLEAGLYKDSVGRSYYAIILKNQNINVNKWIE